MRMRVEYVAEGSRVPEDARPVLSGPVKVAGEFRRMWPEHEKREAFVGFYLDSRNVVLRAEVLSVGSLNASLVHPREVFVPAIRDSAASLILAHNHPSGDPTPSMEDEAITARLHEAGRLLGIELLDHVVVGREDSFVSMREKKMVLGRGGAR